jgi:hypothetical protein
MDAPNALPAKRKPDPRPMRIAIGGAGIAAFSALASAIVMPPSAAVYSPAYAQQPVGGPGTVVGGQAPVLYVQLKPGETAPPGAKVVNSSPGAIVAAAPVAPAPKPIIIRTTQSGRVIK